MTEKTDYQQSRLLWGCKRGMLELDLILQPFVKEQFEHLSESLKADFVALLKVEDPTLFAWLLGHESVHESRFEKIVQIVSSPA